MRIQSCRLPSRTIDREKMARRQRRRAENQTTGLQDGVLDGARVDAGRGGADDPDVAVEGGGGDPGVAIRERSEQRFGCPDVQSGSGGSPWAASRPPRATAGIQRNFLNITVPSCAIKREWPSRRPFKLSFGGAPPLPQPRQSQSRLDGAALSLKKLRTDAGDLAKRPRSRGSVRRQADPIRAGTRCGNLGVGIGFRPRRVTLHDQNDHLTS